ncbi:MAG: type II toxin-antitoxin system RelB/DinJ family antitoxin [Oscillospiraceae bacterium]|nr:type II toxin-antitoxin system RelB/DinJ family antitoxin [Oscillospiraceae bacterium]
MPLRSDPSGGKAGGDAGGRVATDLRLTNSTVLLSLSGGPQICGTPEKFCLSECYQICIASCVTMGYNKIKKGGAVEMAVKSANVSARVEPEVKAEAETIIAQLGLSVSAVINSLYKQIILNRGIPYSLTIPSAPRARDEMSQAEFDAMMETGLDQAKKGMSIPAEKAFDMLLKELDV